MLHSFFTKEELGQGFTPYAFVLFLLALLVIGVVTLYKPFLENVFK